MPLSSLIVSIVALVVAGLALFQERSFSQNPTIVSEFHALHGDLEDSITENINRSTRGPRDYVVKFRVDGPGAVYNPRIEIEDTRESDVPVRWTYCQKDPVLRADHGEVKIFIKGRIGKPGISVILSYDQPRRFRKGSETKHYRHSVPPHIPPQVRSKTEVLRRGKWRPIRMKQITTPAKNPLPPDGKLADDC